MNTVCGFLQTVARQWKTITDTNIKFKTLSDSYVVSSFNQWVTFKSSITCTEFGRRARTDGALRQLTNLLSPRVQPGHARLSF